MALGPTTVQYGSFSVADLVAASNTAVINFGLAELGEYTKLLLAGHNQLLNDEVAFFVQPTTEKVMASDGGAIIAPIENDEFGVVPTQKMAGVQFMGLPIKRYDTDTQWTLDYFENATVGEFLRVTNAVLTGDAQRYARDIRNTLFMSTNTVYNDRLIDNMMLPVKALANADGFPIPPSPNAKQFNPNTHTHYMGTAGTSLAASDVDALIANVTEHYNGGNFVLFTSSNTEAILSGQPGNFPLYVRDTYNGNLASITTINTGVELAQGKPNNRRTGTYRDATVWVKPWMPDGTLACLMVDAVKPIARRVRVAPVNAANPTTAGGDLRLLYEQSDFPLHCKTWRREHGFGIRDRVAAAVMSIGGPVYSQPAQL